MQCRFEGTLYPGQETVEDPDNPGFLTLLRFLLSLTRCPLSLRSAALAPDQHVVKKHLPACPPFPTALRPPALSQALDVCFQKKHLPHRAKNQQPAVRSVPPASVQAAAPSFPNSHLIKCLQAGFFSGKKAFPELVRQSSGSHLSDAQQELPEYLLHTQHPM